MSDAELNLRIAAFLERKDAKFPRIGLIGHDETRTIKFPLPHRMPHGVH